MGRGRPSLGRDQSNSGQVSAKFRLCLIKHWLGSAKLGARFRQLWAGFGKVWAGWSGLINRGLGLASFCGLDLILFARGLDQIRVGLDQGRPNLGRCLSLPMRILGGSPSALICSGLQSLLEVHRCAMGSESKALFSSGP